MEADVSAGKFSLSFFLSFAPAPEYENVLLECLMVKYLTSHENSLLQGHPGPVDLKQQSKESKDSTKLRLNKAKQ